MHRFWNIDAKAAVFATGIVGLFAAACFLALRIQRGIGNFQLTHYYFNYSDEFLKRGLVGEILHQIRFPLSNLNVSLLYSCAVTAFLLLLVLATARIFARLPARTGVLFVLFMLACPGLTLHYAYSAYGYLDIFQLLLSGIGLVAIYRSPLPIAIALTAGFSITSILIHEIGLLVTAPVLVAAVILKFNSPRAHQGAITVFGALMLTTILVWHFGSADTMSFEDHVASLSATAKTPDDIHPAAVLILHRSLAENVGMFLPETPAWYVAQQIKFVLFAAPYLFFFAISLLAARNLLLKKGNRPGAIALLLAVIAPVSLYLVGHDYFRWWSAAMANYFMLTFFLCKLQTDHLTQLVEIMSRHKRVMYAGILIGLTLGGIGGMISFSIHTAPPAMIYRMIF